MCYTKVEDITTDGVVEDCGVEGDDIFIVIGVRRFTTEGLGEGESNGTKDG